MGYPLYDRSGVDDDDGGVPIARSAEPPPKRSAAPADSEVYVCLAGTCRSRGAEAVLTEIEELVKEVGGTCTVRSSGCIGYCNAAPNAAIVQRGARRLDPSKVHSRIKTLEQSAKVVERATGARPSLETAGGRLAGLRAARARQHAVAVSKWNTALHGFKEQVPLKPEHRAELSE